MPVASNVRAALVPNPFHGVQINESHDRTAAYKDSPTVGTKRESVRMKVLVIRRYEDSMSLAPCPHQPDPKLSAAVVCRKSSPVRAERHGENALPVRAQRRQQPTAWLPGVESAGRVPNGNELIVRGIIGDDACIPAGDR